MWFGARVNQKSIRTSATIAPLSLPRAKKRIQKLFDQIAPAYACERAVSARKDVLADAEWIRPQPDDQVLEIGCGPGRLALTLACSAQTVCALDLSQAMLEQARRAACKSRAGNLRFFLADAERLPFPDGCFSLVVCRYCFANFPSPGRVVQEMCRVAGPDGRLAVVEIVAPGDPSHNRRLNRLEQWRSGASTRIQPLESFLAGFRCAGLHLTDCHVLERQQRLSHWLAQSRHSHDRSRHRLLRNEVFRLAGRTDDTWPLYGRGGEWHISHKVARLLWQTSPKAGAALGEAASRL